MNKPDAPVETTHFGYKDVPVEEKAEHVRGVFDSVAQRYDIMNDLMSAGLHRLWKRHTIDQAAARPRAHAETLQLRQRRHALRSLLSSLEEGRRSMAGRR